MHEMLRGMLEDIFGSDFLSIVSDFGQIDLAGRYKTAWEALGKLQEGVVMPLALTLMLIWFMISLYEKVSSDHFTFKSAGKVLIQLLLTFTILTNTIPIAEAAIGIGNASIKQFEQTIGISNIDGDTNTKRCMNQRRAIDDSGQGMVDENGNPVYVLCGAINDKSRKTCWRCSNPISTAADDLWISIENSGEVDGTMKQLGFLCKLIIPWIASWILVACIFFVCVTRIFELFLRILIAPLALSNLFEEGFNGTGFKFLKSLFAVGLQIFVIYGVAWLFGLISSSIAMEGDWLYVIFAQLAISFAAVATTFKAQSLIKEALGAQ